MKKVFGTVKRGINKKVLKVHGIEQKILDATNNESWGPRGTDLAEIAQASCNYHEYQLIMAVIWRRISDTGKNWRHVFKALSVLEYLVAHGPERVIAEIMEHGHLISSLAEFQYIDSSGRDEGINVRKKSQCLVALVNDEESIQEVRLKAQANKDRYGIPNGGEYSVSANSGARRNSDEPYRRDAYWDDNYRGRGNDDSQFGPRSRSVDGYTDGFGEDDLHSSRSGGSNAVQPTDERELEHNADALNVAALPSYDDMRRNSQDIIQDESVEETVASSPPPLESQSQPKSTVQGAESAAASQSNIIDAFEEFDPRSASAMRPSASSPELDIFGFSASDSADPLAMVPVNSTASSTPTTSVFGTDFLAASSSSSPASSQPYENPFGDAPFKATPQENTQAQPQNFPQFQSSSLMGGSETLPSATQKAETFQHFDFGGALGSLTFAPAAANGQHASSEFPLDKSSDDILDSMLPRTGSSTMFSSHEPQPVASVYPRSDYMNPFQSFGTAGPVVAHGESLTNTQTDQMNPFQPSIQSQPAHMNPFQPLGLSASVASQGFQTSAQNLLPPSGLSASSSSQGPTMQMFQTSSPKQSNPPVQEVSQGLPNNVQASHMNFFQPSGPPAPAASQAPITKIQTIQMASSQQSGESVPSASQGSPKNAQASQINFFQPSGPQASEEPTTNMQTAYMSSPQQQGVSVASAPQGIPNNMPASQMNFFQPSGPSSLQEPTISTPTAQRSSSTQSVPSASQGSATNMQTSQMNFQLAGSSTTTASQESTPNMQTAQMNSPQPSGLSVLTASQGPPPTNVQTSQMNFNPAGSSATTASQELTQNMQRTQMTFPLPSGPVLPASQAPPPNNMQIPQMSLFQPFPGVSQQGPQINMEASHMNFFQPSASQGLYPSIQTGQLNFHPSASQGLNPNMHRGQLNFHPSSLSSSGALQTHMQRSQPNSIASSGPPASTALQELQSNFQITQTNFMQPSGPAQGSASTNMQAADYVMGMAANLEVAPRQANSQAMSLDPFATQAGSALARPTAKPQPSKFETKSTVWADTLNRGLVNLDISGPKTNPLADIGIDFDAINRKEKRLEPKSNAPPATSIIVMGKAMGSGSGMGRSATGGLTPNSMMGSGMGMGGRGMDMGMMGSGMDVGMRGMGMGGVGGMGMGMGMRGGVGMGMSGGSMGSGMGMGGYGVNMNQPPIGMNMGMGMNIGMGQGAPMQPPGPGMPGGYNPMTGMGGYGPQQSYSGGYR